MEGYMFEVGECLRFRGDGRPLGTDSLRSLLAAAEAMLYDRHGDKRAPLRVATLRLLGWLGVHPEAIGEQLVPDVVRVCSEFANDWDDSVVVQALDSLQRIATAKPSEQVLVEIIQACWSAAYMSTYEAVTERIVSLMSAILPRASSRTSLRPSRVRATMVKALRLLAWNESACSARLREAVFLLVALLEASASNAERQLMLETLHSFAECKDADEAQLDTILSIVESLVQNQRTWPTKDAAESLADIVRGLATRAPEFHGDSAVFGRTIAACARLSQGQPSMRMESVFQALGIVAKSRGLGVDELDRAVAICSKAAIAKELSREELSAAAHMLSQIARHPSASTRMLGAVVDAVVDALGPGAKADPGGFQRADPTSVVLQRLLPGGKDAPAHGLAHVAVVARSFVLANRLASDTFIVRSLYSRWHTTAQVSDQLAVPSELTASCPAVLALLVETPLPLYIAQVALRFLPAELRNAINVFAAEPQLQDSYMGVVDVCFDAALAGDVHIARWLWRAACVPMPAVAAAAADAFVRVSWARGWDVVGPVISPEDLAAVARCLGVSTCNKDHHGVFVDTLVLAAEVERAYAILLGLEELFRAWPPDRRAAAAPNLSAICASARRCAEAVQSCGSAGDAAALRSRLAKICGDLFPAQARPRPRRRSGSGEVADEDDVPGSSGMSRGAHDASVVAIADANSGAGGSGTHLGGGSGELLRSLASADGHAGSPRAVQVDARRRHDLLGDFAGRLQQRKRAERMRRRQRRRQRAMGTAFASSPADDAALPA